MLDLDALHSLAVFAEKRNFTHAAEALHISQPALHVKIRKLADSVGVALYRRNGRSLEITPAGRELARLGRELQGSVEEALAAIRGERVVETVVLAAGEGAILYFLSDAVRQYVQAGAARLQLLTRDREGTIEAVRSGDAHLGVATLDSLPPGLAAIDLLRSQQIVVMPSRHPLSRKRSLALADLEGEALIVPPAGRPHREAIARALLDAGVPWRVAVEANGWPVMLALARSGIGLAIVNDICALPPGVVARPLRGIPATHYHLIHRRGRMSDALQALAATIRAAARR